MTAILHEALDLFDRQLRAIEAELEAFLGEHPLAEAAAKDRGGKAKPRPPRGNDGPWRWDIFTILNGGPTVDDPNSVIYQTWYPGLFR